MIKNIYLLLGLLLLNLATGTPTAMVEIEEPVFKYGVSGVPETIDPAQAWDSASIDLLDQVCEGLLAYDLYNPELALIPRLATNLGVWNAEATEVTFTLRQNVTFHDGSPFNASIVKYTFDRLNHLIETALSQIAELYEPLATLYPTTPLVINETVVMSEFVVKFILNYPYVPFMSLLCFSGSYIVHPDIPFDRLINLDENLIGTGPYKLEFYIEDEIHFSAYKHYYRHQPQIQKMIWIYYEDSLTLAQAFLAGDVDMPDSTHPDYIAQYQSEPNIHVDPPKVGPCIYYLGMNNKKINQTLRQVISSAIDYNYIITQIMNNQVKRMTSVIPVGTLYHDPTVVTADYDLKKARQILVDHNLTGELLATSSDLEWYNLTETSPIATFNYTYDIGNHIRGDLGLLIQSNLKLVGIKINLNSLSWQDYLPYLCLCGWDPPKPDLFTIGWCADYNDPSIYINPLMSNTSLSNSAQINDPWLQNAMIQALAETNTTARRALYSEMQHYITEELMPWVFLFSPVSVISWSVHLECVPLNAMRERYFYPIHWWDTSSPCKGCSECDDECKCGELTDTSNTTPTTSSAFISGNVRVILLSLCCISIILSYVLRKKIHLNHYSFGIGD